MRIRPKKLMLALRRVVLVALSLCVLATSAGRFGFRPSNTQCPTAPVQQIAIMVHQPDGSYVREMRSPRPGEKDFVVCHCQEKRSAQQAGWFVPAYPVAMLAPALIVDIPRFYFVWEQCTVSFDIPEPPGRLNIHPPSV